MGGLKCATHFIFHFVPTICEEMYRERREKYERKRKKEMLKQEIICFCIFHFFIWRFAKTRNVLFLHTTFQIFVQKQTKIL
jgi:hypothetical protein